MTVHCFEMTIRFTLLYKTEKYDFVVRNKIK